MADHDQLASEVPVDPEAERGVTAELDAATKIQAVHRGKATRKEIMYKKEAHKVTDDRTPAEIAAAQVQASAVHDDAAAHVDMNVPASARAYIPMQEPAEESRLSVSDGMVPRKRRGQNSAMRSTLRSDTALLEEASMTKAELVKRNVENAINERRQNLLAKQAMKEERFRITRNREQREIAERKKDGDARRKEKLIKVKKYEEKQERWKAFMYQKMASEARLKQEREAIRRATRIEANERRHQALEGESMPKKSYLDPHLRMAAAVPGPGAYKKADGVSLVSGGRFGTGAPKTSLEWTIYRAKQIPGPAEYSPANAGHVHGFRFSKTASKSTLDWEIHRAKQLPGPGEYSPRKPTRGGSVPRFSATNAKSTLDWVEARARKLPGPAEYFKEPATMDGGIRFSDARPKSDLEWSIHRAKDLPGPGEYGAPMVQRKTGFRFGASKAKTDVEWQIYYAKRRPGPGSYFPTPSFKERAALDRDAKEKVRKDATMRSRKVVSQMAERGRLFVQEPQEPPMTNYVPALEI